MEPKETFFKECKKAKKSNLLTKNLKINFFFQLKRVHLYNDMTFSYLTSIYNKNDQSYLCLDVKMFCKQMLVGERKQKVISKT